MQWYSCLLFCSTRPLSQRITPTRRRKSKGIINKMKSQNCTVQAYLWFSLFVCVGLEGPVGKNSVAFKSWRSLEKNTERRREGEERERGRWENSDGKKEWDGGGRFQQAAWNQVITEIKRCHQFVWRSIILNLPCWSSAGLGRSNILPLPQKRRK